MFDVGHENGIDFLVLEYIDGETLADRLARGPLKFDEALAVAIQIADALDKAHRAGIVHRDLKPANVMLTSVGAKLLDFGLAKLQTQKPAVSGLSIAATGTRRSTMPSRRRSRMTDMPTKTHSVRMVVAIVAAGGPSVTADCERWITGSGTAPSPSEQTARRG